VGVERTLSGLSANPHQRRRENDTHDILSQRTSLQQQHPFQTW